VNAGEVSAEDIILEIGPGQGDLTWRLITLAAKVIAVEKDDRLFELLQEKFKTEIRKGGLDLIHGDILDFDPDTLSFYTDFSYKLIANIPYNLTGAIFKKFLSAKTLPERIVLMVQKEVAERIVARDKKESILSLSIKAYGAPKYVETVKAGSFSPAPSVDSAILLIEGVSKDFFKDVSEDKFFKVVKTGFKSKRKKLFSNLASVFPKENVENAWKTMNLDQNIRAEDTGVHIWKEISKIV
jgi:16S rRNA (adenine1518-N6/adenine1519-N6)-dimethyltransferase